MINSLFLGQLADRIGDVGVDEGYDAAPHRFVRCNVHLARVHKLVKEQVMPDEHHRFSGERLHDGVIHSREDLDENEHGWYRNSDCDEEHSYLEVFFGD